MQKWQLPFPGYLSLGPPLQLIHWLPGLTFPLNIVTPLQLWFSKLKPMRCKDLEDKTCLLLGLVTSRDLGKGTQCTLKYISLTLIPSQMHFDLGVCGKWCSFQSGPVLSHEHGHQWLLAWKQVPHAASHPQTRACFFCSLAWPTAGFSNHVGRRDEGPEVSHITPTPALLAAVTAS